MKSSIGASFPSRWSALCPHCGERWEAGDMVCFVDDEVVCARSRDQIIDDNVWYDEFGEE